MLDSNSSMSYAPEERTNSLQSSNSFSDAAPGRNGLKYMQAYGYDFPKSDKKVKTNDLEQPVFKKSNSALSSLSVITINT